MPHNTYGGDLLESRLFENSAKAVGSQIFDPLILNQNPINEGSLGVTNGHTNFGDETMGQD